ncbi:MAG: DUF4203 domain-containing protein [Thermomicrobiales bacterium]|nr:DUF4203 domain-containing protein [Thermomicrobiales bacterium]
MDILVGLLMLLAGATLLLSGLRVFAIMLPILGFMAGISLGLAIMYWAFDEGILSTAAGLVVGIILGIVFAVLSYLFWYVAVVMGGAMIGASLGAGLMNLFGVNTNWVIAVAAIVGGILAAFLTIALDLPIYWVVVVTAFNGAAWVIAGVLLIFDKLERSELGYGTVWAIIDESPWWLIAWAVLAAVGVGAQLTQIARVVLPSDPWTKTPAPQM